MKSARFQEKKKQRRLARLKLTIGSYWMGGPTRVFTFGSCHGLCVSYEGWFTLVAVVNDRPGNGHFVALMNMLEAAHNVRVSHFDNEGLRMHLLTKRGYRPRDEDDAVEHRLTCPA